MDLEGLAGALAEACEKAAEDTVMLIAMAERPHELPHPPRDRHGRL